MPYVAPPSPHPQPSHSKSIKPRDFSPFSRKNLNRDLFWYHSLDSEPPSNYTPGLIPLLRKSLLSLVNSGSTRRAVLCYEGAVHIYHEPWDSGWGCGYRNYMMACAALMDQHTRDEYLSLLDTQSPPGVNNLMSLIEEAWSHGEHITCNAGLCLLSSIGFDAEGAEQLKGRLTGSKKWIGTAELYVAFTYRGIPSQLADFNVSKDNVAPLLDWVKRYFDATQSSQATVNELWQKATPVVVTDHMPIILQYQGHSRTIVGYEIGKNGTITLLTFDPSRRMVYIYDAALSMFNASRHRDTPRAESSSHSTASRLKESLKKSFQSRGKKRSDPTDTEKHGDGAAKRHRAGSIGGDNEVIVIEDSEPEEPTSKPPSKSTIHERESKTRDTSPEKDKKALDPKKVLKLFRIDERQLAKHDKYQVLWFPMEDPLSEAEKQARRVVTSEKIC